MTNIVLYRYVPEDVDVRRGGMRAVVGEPVREIQPSVRSSPSYVPCPNEHPEGKECSSYSY